jgi:hypothetical protein
MNRLTGLFSHSLCDTGCLFEIQSFNHSKIQGQAAGLSQSWSEDYGMAVISDWRLVIKAAATASRPCDEGSNPGTIGTAGTIPVTGVPKTLPLPVAVETRCIASLQ